MNTAYLGTIKPLKEVNPTPVSVHLLLYEVLLLKKQYQT